MMKLIFFIMTLIGLSILSSVTVNACMSGPPAVETKSNYSFCLLGINNTILRNLSNGDYPCRTYKNEEPVFCKSIWAYEYFNDSWLSERFNASKTPCNLTDEDIPILKSFVSNGYSVKEQNDEEYSIFLKEANKANEWRPASCLAYIAVSHKGRWTGFIKGTDLDVKGRCPEKTKSLGCGGSGNSKIVWSDLSITKRTYAYIFVPIIAVVLVTVLVLSFKRKKSD